MAKRRTSLPQHPIRHRTNEAPPPPRQYQRRGNASPATREQQRRPCHRQPGLFEIAWRSASRSRDLHGLAHEGLHHRWHLGQAYCLLGPGRGHLAQEFEESPATGPLGRRCGPAAVGLGVLMGAGSSPASARRAAGPRSPCRACRDQYCCGTHTSAHARRDKLLNGVVTFGYMSNSSSGTAGPARTTRPIIAHFHEWIGGSCILELRRRSCRCRSSSRRTRPCWGATCHERPVVLRPLPFVNWLNDARDSTSSRGPSGAGLRPWRARVVTLSDITAFECEYLSAQARRADAQRINIERFAAVRELRAFTQYRRRSTSSHGTSFPATTSTSTDADFFTSGRTSTQQGFT